MLEHAAPKLAPGLARHAFENRAILFSLVKAFAPDDFAPFLDAISDGLDDLEFVSEEGEAWDRLETLRPDPEVEQILSSPQFQQLAGGYYWRNCQSYGIELPPPRLPQAIMQEIAVLRSTASDQEKMCRALALAALSSRPLLTQLMRLAR